MNDLNLRAAKIQLRGLIAALAIAIIIAAGITTGAFVLSFHVLRDLGLQGMLPPSLTWIFPAIVDGAILASTISAVVLNKISGPSAGRTFFLCLLISVVTISVAGNGYHAFRAAEEARALIADGVDLGFTPLHPMGAALITVIPPLLVLAFTHGVGVLIKAIGDAYREYSLLAANVAESTPANVGDGISEDSLGVVPVSSPDRDAPRTDALTPVAEDVAQRNSSGVAPAVEDSTRSRNATSVAASRRAIVGSNTTVVAPTDSATAPRNATSEMSASDATPRNATLSDAPTSAMIRTQPGATTDHATTDSIAIQELADTPRIDERARSGSTSSVSNATGCAPAPTEHHGAGNTVDSNNDAPATTERAGFPPVDDADAPRMPFADRVASRVAQLGEDDIAAKFDKRSAPAFGEKPALHTTRTLEELIAFIDSAEELEPAVKETAKLKFNDPGMSFSELAKQTGARAASTAMRRYRKAEDVARAHGFTSPPLPDLDPSDNADTATHETGLIGAM